MQVSGGHPPYSYFWSSGDTSQTLTQLNQGSYSVEIVDAYGCVDSTTVSVKGPPLSTEDDLLPNIKIGPNPGSGTLVIQADQGEVGMIGFKIISSLGQMVKQGSIYVDQGAFHHTISLEGLPDGVYLLDLDANQQNLRRKIILRR